MIANAGLFVLYVLVSSFGLFKLKIANGTFGLDFLVGLTGYGAGFLIWYFILTRLPLSVAFPVAAGSLVAASQVVGFLALDETMQFMHVGGILLILVGIVLIFANA